MIYGYFSKMRIKMRISLLFNQSEMFFMYFNVVALLPCCVFVKCARNHCFIVSFYIKKQFYFCVLCTYGYVYSFILFPNSLV